MASVQIEISLHEQSPPPQPRIQIDQGNQYQQTDLFSTTLLTHRLQDLVEQYNGNIVEALLAVVPVTGTEIKP